jgi:hypothetical protein
MRENIENNIKDLVSGFLYYDRKEDEELPRGAIEQAVKDRVISVEEMAALFKSELEKGLK